MGPPWGWTWSEREPNEELMRSVVWSSDFASSRQDAKRTDRCRRSETSSMKDMSQVCEREKCKG